MCQNDPQKRIISSAKTLSPQNRRRLSQKEWIEKIHQLTGDSYSKIARNAGLAQSTVSRFMDDAQTSGTLSAATEEKIIAAYSKHLPRRNAPVPPSTPSKNHPLSPLPTRQVEVRGYVQAGLWREAMELPYDDRCLISAYVPQEFQSVPYYGLTVRGESMNRIFPDGSIVIVANFADLARGPETGDYVVALRRDPFSASFEATVKAFQQKENGDIFLWPRSTDPLFQRPFILKKASFPAPSDMQEADFTDSAEAPEISVLGLVIGVQIATPKCIFS